MATDATIERCFERLRLVHRAWIDGEEWDALVTEWKSHLGDYSEAAVLDATDALVLADEFPGLNAMLAAVQRAARDIRQDQEFAWGRAHPEDDPDNIDPAGRKKLLALMRQQFGLRDLNSDNPGIASRDLYMGHERHHSHKVVGGASAVECPVCSIHDHSDGAAYCPACIFDEQGIKIGDPDRVVSICRAGCDPVSHLVLVWVDDRNVEMPDGVQSKTWAVKPCPRCRADDYEAWQLGTWGARATRKGKSKRVNASASDDD